MIVVGCSHGKHIGYKIAKRLKCTYTELLVNKFPDDELLVRFNADLSGKTIVLVQSFYGSISDCIMEVILASATARDLGAKRIILAAPYFPYMRQDKRFHKGESVSQSIIAKLFDKYFDSVYIIDPHLHRKNSLAKIFKIKAEKLTANQLIADYIKKHIKNPVIIGPDEESYKWARSVAELLGVESAILNKKRYSSFNVKVSINKKIDFKGKNAVIVDDIVSTGHTILETVKILRKLGAKNIYCICVHGIFVNDALKKLRKNKISVISTNTIPSKVAKIDVSRVIVKALKE